MSFTPTTLAIHYTATFEDQNPTVAEITKWHKAAGMRTFAYHWYIDRLAKLFEGRPEYEMGAGVRHHNGYTLHVAWAGGLNRATGKDVGVWNITPDQEAQLVTLITDILERHPSIKRVVGHRNLNPSQCPGRDDVAAWWASKQRKPATPAPTTPSGLWASIIAALTRLFGRN